MLGSFNKISLKLLVVCLSFSLPIAVMLSEMIAAKRKDIDFTVWEKKGNSLQRPLETMLQSLSHYRDLSQQQALGDTSHTEELSKISNKIDQDLDQIKTSMNIVGTDLQFTAEGLGKRQRLEFTIEHLSDKWQAAKALAKNTTSEEVNKVFKDLSLHVRTMITHTGDTSNLILDPDLDSYYLMDVTLLALPQTQDRIQEINHFVQNLAKKTVETQAERVQAMVFASFLQEADLDRINASSQTSLNEDANFYGASPSLQKNLSQGMKENASSIEPVIRSLKELSATSDLKKFNFKQLLDQIRTANDALYTYHTIAFDELDNLLDSRVDKFKADVKNAIVWTSVSLAISSLLAFLITANIIVRLKRVNVTTKKIAEGDLSARVDMKSGDEIGELAHSFDTMTDKVVGLNREIAIKNEELVGINGNLEKIVAERTATIKTILDNVKFGFLLVSKDLTVQEGFSKSCVELLGKDLKPGSKFLKSVGISGTRLEPMVVEFLAQAFEDSLPEEMTLRQLPPRVQLGEKILSLQGSVIRNPKNDVVAILFTIIDATSIELMEKENHRHKVLVRLLKEQDSFKDFLEETKTRLKLCRQFIAKNEQGKLRAELHTIKGNTSAYDMIDIAKLIHHIEDIVKVDVSDIDRIEASYVGFLESNFDVLQLPWTGDSTENYAVSKDDLNAIILRVRESAGTDTLAVNELAQWASSIQMKSAKSLVGALPDYGERLAMRLGKPCKIRVEGGDTKMDPEIMRPIMQSIVHLVRNAIDHGLEPAFERSSKPEEGSVSIKCEDHPNMWKVLIADDGRGIDVDRVTDKAVATGQITLEKAKAMNHKDKCKLVFLNGVSTSEEVTEISGRGVGMGAVSGAVLESGGTLDIDSKLHFGTTVTITVPKVKGKSMSKKAA